MEEDLISVICTVKNGENTLVDTLESVVNQTYKNWEFVIVDDGSEDLTVEIIEKFSRIDKRIKLIKTLGVGRGEALNLAIKNSLGKYIANIDADDLMHPDRLLIQHREITKGNNIFLVCANTITIYDNEEVVWKEENYTKISSITKKILLKNTINHSSVMFNKSSLISLGCYNKALKSQFDYELWLRALAESKILIKVSNQLIAKRIHENQSFENKKRLTYLLRSQKLQFKYSLIMKEKFFVLLILSPIRILIGLLPFKLRLKLNVYVKKILFI